MYDYSGNILDNRYLVGKRIGKGGMGVVYQGEHTIIGRKVAIKFLNAEFAKRDDMVARFYREARASTKIGHRNIIEILDVGISDHQEPFIVMEYLEGEDLSTLLKHGGPLDLAAACGILEPVLSALQVAHDNGVVHRDLKPENIFIARDPAEKRAVVKLIDFGISKLMSANEDDRLTHTGLALGTPYYMSPEQAMGADQVDHRTDIYAMGVILFEILTGETPYVGTSNQNLMMQILTSSPRDPYEVNPNFPNEAYPIVQRAMARDPSERYQSADDMLHAFSRLSIFDERISQMTACTSSIMSGQCAMGDLGGYLSTSGSRASDKALQAFVNRSTPGNWTGTKHSVTPNRQRWGIALTALFLILAAAAALFLIHDKKDKTVASAITVTKPPRNRTGPVAHPFEEENPHGAIKKNEAISEAVRITLKGVPLNATVMFGDHAVSSQSFEVPKQDLPQKLSVQCPGYETFTKAVFPTQDLTIQVTMDAIATRPMPPSPSQSPSQRPTTTSQPRSDKRATNLRHRSKAHKNAQKTEPKTKTPHDNNGFIKGKRKTVIAKDFE